MPRNVENPSKYIADKIENVTGNIFTVESKAANVRLRVLNNGVGFPGGVSIEAEKSEILNLGRASSFTVGANYKVDKLPSNPNLELVLPFSNGPYRVVVPAFIKQNWWLTEPGNENSIPKNISANNDENALILLLPPNSNRIKVPLQLDKKWLSTDKSLTWHYPLDEVKTDGNGGMYIEDLIAGRNGVLVEQPLKEGEKLVVASVEKDGKKAIDFNKQFLFKVNEPTFAFPEDSEYTISIWYYKTPKPPSTYLHFCNARYTNNLYYMSLQFIGTQNRHYVRFGGYGSTYEAHYYYHVPEMDQNDTGWFLYTWSRDTKTGQSKYYVNGVLVQTQTDRLYPIGQGSRRIRDMKIGKYNNNAFIGHVADFKGFNKALTDDEVMSLYNLERQSNYRINGSVNLTLNGLAIR